MYSNSLKPKSLCKNCLRKKNQFTRGQADIFVPKLFLMLFFSFKYLIVSELYLQLKIQNGTSDVTTHCIGHTAND